LSILFIDLGKVKKGTGRYGIIKMMSYNEVDHVIEVEEIEVAGDLTKVNVVGVCEKYDRHKYKNDSKKVLSDDRFLEWVKTSSIIWYDGNTQRIRDERLKEILG